MKRSAFLLALVLAACGDAATTTTTPPASAEPSTTTTTTVAVFPLPTGADEVVLQLDRGVNQPDPLPIASAYPTLTIYGDGRVIFDDRSGSGGAMPSLVEARLAPEGIQLLVAEAARRGALKPLDRYGFTGVADDDSTRFVVNAGSAQADFGVYGLGDRLEAPGAEVTPEQAAARVELQELERVLLGWQEIVEEHVVEPPRPYEFETLLVMGDTHTELQFTDGRVLPADVLAGGERYETRVEPLLCVEVSGELLAEILPALRAGERYGAWEVGGEAWRLEFRPVLPHEPGCEILPDQ